LARHSGADANITAEVLAPSIAPKIRIENLDGDVNYAIPETWAAAIKERIPEETIRGATDKRLSSGNTLAPEVLVETVDDDGEVTTPVDTDIHQVDMFACQTRGKCPNAIKTISRIQPTTLPTTPQVTVLSTWTRRRSIPESMLTSRQEELSPQSRWQTS
jgi:hypothetical protein